jgi:two-component sensor histidine kinase
MAVALSLSLSRELSAPAAARRAIEHRFDQLSSERVAELALVVTELVSNAVKYGRGAITLKIHHDNEVVRGEVIDEGGGFEREVRERGPEDVSGRGLFVVEALCSRWGIHEGTTHVWFELHAPGGPTKLTKPQLGDAQRPDALDRANDSN